MVVYLLAGMWHSVHIAPGLDTQSDHLDVNYPPLLEQPPAKLPADDRLSADVRIRRQIYENLNKESLARVLNIPEF